MPPAPSGPLAPEAGMITQIQLDDQTTAPAIICRVFPTEFDVFCLGRMRTIDADHVLPPREISRLTRRITLFRLYSHFKWRIGEWKHLRFVKYGRGNTGVVANNGQIWSFYEFEELEAMFEI